MLSGLVGILGPFGFLLWLLHLPVELLGPAAVVAWLVSVLSARSSVALWEDRLTVRRAGWFSKKFSIKLSEIAGAELLGTAPVALSVVLVDGRRVVVGPWHLWTQARREQLEQFAHALRAKVAVSGGGA